MLKPPTEEAPQPPSLTGLWLEDDEVLVDVGSGKAKAGEPEEEVKEVEEEEEDHEEMPAKDKPTIPWEDQWWTEEESNQHGRIRMYEERQALLIAMNQETTSAMEVDAAPSNSPVVDELDNNTLDPRLWRNAYEQSEYSIGRRSASSEPTPQHPTKVDSQLNRMLFSENEGILGEEVIVDLLEKVKEVARKRKTIVHRYLHNFISKRPKGSLSRNPGDAPSS